MCARTYVRTPSHISPCSSLWEGRPRYAATTLAPNSVGAAQIQRSAAHSAEVKNGSLMAKDFKPGQLPAPGTGPAGPTGPTGPTGPAGVVYAAQASTGENPASPFTNGTTSVALQLPSAGKVYAYGRVRVNAVCAGNVTMTAGLYRRRSRHPGNRSS